MQESCYFTLIFNFIIPPAFMQRRILFSPFRSYVHSFVRASVTSRSWNLPQSFPQCCVKVSQVGYISRTIHQKAFIFGPLVPLKVCFLAMTFGPRVRAPGWGWRSKTSVFLLFLWKELAQIVGQTWLNLVTLTCRS